MLQMKTTDKAPFTPSVRPVAAPWPTDSQSPGELTCSLHTSFEGLDSLRENWDEAVSRLGGSIYMTYDWLKTWWEFYGRGMQLRLFVFQSGEDIVGLLPLYVDRLGPWPLGVGVARLVGASIPPKVFDPPLHPDWAAQCVEYAVTHLIRSDACALVSLGPISSDCAPWQGLAERGVSSGSGWCWERSVSGVHSVFSLPERMDEYLNRLGRNEQKNRRRYELRMLSKEYAVRVEVLSACTEVLLDEFDQFAEQHARQWRSEGKPGHFGAWPEALAYNRALVQAHGPLGRLRLLRIWAGDQVVARQYTYAWGQRWFMELPARATGQPWDRFSLGPSAIVTMIGEAIKAGVPRLEGGLGHYEYKLRLQAREHATYTYRAKDASLLARLRLCIADVVRLSLCYGYHKFWYARVQPRLPARFHWPQWSLWLRFDF